MTFLSKEFTYERQEDEQQTYLYKQSIINVELLLNTKNYLYIFIDIK